MIYTKGLKACRGQGLGAASAPAAAVPLKKVASQRPDAAAVLLTEHMRIVRQYDLTTAACIVKFAQEMKIAHPCTHGRGHWLHESRRCARGAQSRHPALRRFLECHPSGSWRRTQQAGSTISMGAWCSALCTSLPQIRNSERSQSKFEEHLTSARCLRPLWSAPCSGPSCLVTPTCSKSTDCTWSPVLDPRSAGMLHHPLHLVLIVHGSATAIAQPHVTRGVFMLVGVETNTVMCIHSGE